MSARFLLACCAVLGACSSRPEVVLRITSWQSPAENALDLPAIRAFEAAHPGVRVENEPVSNQAEYREKVITSIVAGAPPDVFLMDNIDVPAFAAAEVALDLAPFAARVGLSLRAFQPTVLGIFEREGKLLGFPKGYSPVVYYYNRALFDAAGIVYPQDGWTWAEFVATARALTRDADRDGEPEQWGTTLVRPFYAWQGVIWSAGGDILTEDGQQASGALDGGASVAAIDFLTSLAGVHGVAPRPNALRAVIGNETRMFVSGRVAMLPSGHWLIPSVRAAIESGELRLGVVSMPTAPGVAPSTPLFASAWAVPRNTRHRKLAVALAAALAGPEAQRHRLASGLELSAMPQVQQAFAAADATGLEAAFARQVAFGRAPWGVRQPRFREIEALLPEVLDEVMAGGRTPQDAASDVAKRIDAVLRR